MNPTVSVWADRFLGVALAALIVFAIAYASKRDALPANPFRIRGYEKFWLALLSGGSQVVPITVTVLLVGWAMNLPEYMPEQAAILSAITVFWTAIFSALGALLGFNTVPADPIGNPPPVAPLVAPQGEPPAASGTVVRAPVAAAAPAPPAASPEPLAATAEPVDAPDWEPVASYPAGKLVTFNGAVYESKVDQISQPHLTPDLYPDQWERWPDAG